MKKLLLLIVSLFGVCFSAQAADFTDIGTPFSQASTIINTETFSTAYQVGRYYQKWVCVSPYKNGTTASKSGITGTVNVYESLDGGTVYHLRATITNPTYSGGEIVEIRGPASHLKVSITKGEAKTKMTVILKGWE